MGKKSRTKGHGYEREIASDLREKGYKDARRHLEYQDGEANGVDIKNAGRFLIQCKRKKNYVSINTINEIQVPDTGDWIPLLVTKADSEPAMVVLKWDDFLNFIPVPSGYAKRDE